MKEKTDVYQLVTDRILEALRQGVIPWRKTWSGGVGLAQNYHTKVVYRGINALLTNLSPYEIPYFVTFKQAKALGGLIKKGSKSIPIVFWKPFFVDGNNKPIDEEQASRMNDAKKRFVLRYYSVFNIEDCEGIDFHIPQTELKTHDPIEACEQLIDAIPNPPQLVTKLQSKAYYAPLSDTISMPKIGQFYAPEAFYSTLFHEQIHATGHESRLKRMGIVEPAGFGTDPYAQEELIAEIGAAFLCKHTGISFPKLFTNQAAYIAGWLGKLEDDKRFVLQAATKAKQAVGYMLGQ